jgi:hypothetical protein
VWNRSVESYLSSRSVRHWPVDPRFGDPIASIGIRSVCSYLDRIDRFGQNPSSTRYTPDRVLEEKKLGLSALAKGQTASVPWRSRERAGRSRDPDDQRLAISAAPAWRMGPPIAHPRARVNRARQRGVPSWAGPVTGSSYGFL